MSNTSPNSYDSKSSKNSKNSTSSKNSKTSTSSKNSKNSTSSKNSKTSTTSKNSKNSTSSRKLNSKKKKVIKTILTSRGYSLVKEHCSFRELHKCKKNLNVQPFIPGDFGGKTNPFPVYLESLSKLYVPRHYGIQHFGEPDQVKRSFSQSIKIDLEFKGSLRPKQREPVKAFMDTCKRGSYSSQSCGGIVSIECGGGKTVLALNLISRLKRKAIIIVHKEFLMDQWRERIIQFLPDARIGIIQQKKIQIENKDIVIAMLQSISMKNYPQKTFDDFGFAIVDECHHIGSEVFSRSLPKIGCKYMLGLSATPKRKDGLSKVFHWYLGPMVYSSITQNVTNVEIKLINFYSEQEPYSKEELTYTGKMCMPKMINNVCAYYKRTEFIVELIKEAIEENRKIILLSDRRAHLDDLFELVTQQEICTVGYYVGGMKNKDRKISETKQLMLSTFTMASEGLDVKELNTAIFASPKSDIRQSIGRILRQKSQDIPPRVYDIVDKFSCFVNQGIKRRRYYKKNNYKIESISIRDDNSKISELLKQYREGGINFEQYSKPLAIPKGVCLI